MNRKLKRILLGAVCTAAGAAAASELPTGNLNPAYFPSNVQAQLQVGIGTDTDAVHFVRDTSDSKIITKTYVLKNADPAEIRPYLRNMVQTVRTNPGLFNGVTAKVANHTELSTPLAMSAYYDQYLKAPTGVETMVLMDGTGLLIVSAEEYRFKDGPDGMGIDSIVAKLDAKGIKNSSGQPKFLYFPKNRPASELLNMIEAVGANMSDDTTELIGGKDKVREDKDLNALFFNTALYSKKNIEEMLKLYDVPHPQVRIRYTVYELMAENDGKIGADFQAWKNNEGANFFSMGGTYRDNWSATYAGGMVKGGKHNLAEFINFNPKWNTRYLDFLVSKNKAKIAMSGEVRARNNQATVMNRSTGVFIVNAKEDTGAATTISSGYVKDQGSLDITSAGGHKVTANGPFSVVKIQTPSTVCYDLQGVNGTTFTIAGRSEAVKTVEAARIKDDSSIKFYLNAPADGGRGPEIITKPANGFAFNMTVTPSVTEKATTLKVGVTATSLLGYASSGAPRLATSVSENDVMIGNTTGNRFVIGGIQKSEVVRSSTGIPLLKDIPVLGWLFSSEGESTKNSQLVIVAECELVTPATAIPAELQGDITDIKDAVSKNTTGEFNSYGFRQFGLDPER